MSPKLPLDARRSSSSGNLLVHMLSLSDLSPLPITMGCDAAPLTLSLVLDI